MRELRPLITRYVQRTNLRQSSVYIILHNCRVIDGVADVARENCDVIVEHGKILAVEAVRDRSSGEHYVIPVTGMTILPGLIDCHSHYLIYPWGPDPFKLGVDGSHGQLVLQGARCASVALLSGVTTTRDAGAADGLNLILRDAIHNGLVPGPRIVAAGRSITITGGHGCNFGREADGIDELRKAVREEMRHGADVIKIIASEAAMRAGPEAGVEELTQNEIEVIVSEARRRGLRSFSHAQNSKSVVRSALGGVHSVEHAFLADTQSIRTLRECGTALVPTLAVTAVTLERTDLPEWYRSRMLEIQKMHWTSCEKAISEGVSVVAGTDCGVPGILPNMLWREICLLNERGLKPMDAIKAATIRAAELVGLDHIIGSIEPGKQADLIAVQGNPVNDLACLSDVAVVMKAGKVQMDKHGTQTF